MSAPVRSVATEIEVAAGETVVILGGTSQGVGTLGSRREQYSLVTEGAGGGVTWSLEVLLKKSAVWRSLLTAQAQTDIAVLDIPGIDLLRITFSAGVAEGTKILFFRENK